MNLLDESREFKDAGQRIVDTVNLHLVAPTDIMENVGKWAVFALSDGRSDGVVYDTKDDALRHHKLPKNYCYMRITPDGITLRDALSFLRISRLTWIDTTAPEPIISPHYYPQMSNLTPGQRNAIRRHEEEARRNEHS